VTILTRTRLTHTVEEIRALVADWRRAGESVGLAPTMGNLHAGHLSLARLAAKQADRVVMSIFVNPTQFGAGEDFAAYPRTLEDDLAQIESAGVVDALFLPAEHDVYPFGTEAAVRIVLPPLSRELCGAFRPGHFDGVATVVCRLLNIVQPDRLVLGQKDYQQFVLLRRMAADLQMPVTLVCGPTQREADGLAMSSRNRYLEADERAKAPALYAALQEIRERLLGGATDHAALEARARERLTGAGFRPDYVEIRRVADLAKPAAGDSPEELIVLAAARLGRARLIDNVRV
jgi:pantoate--beta-alanine ligase